MLERLKRLAYIVSKGAKPPIEDEANPAYNEGDDAGLSVGQEEAGAGTENLEEMFGPTKRKRNPAVRYDLSNPEHKRQIRERLLDERKKNQEVNDFRGGETDITEDVAMSKYMKMKKELEENAEAQAEGQRPPYDGVLIRKEMADLIAKFPDLERLIADFDSEMGPISKEVDNNFDAEWAKGTPAYDRATDEAKNQEAMNEMQETVDEVEGKGRNSANKRKDEEVGIDDVMVLAETMYSPKEAQTALNNMDEGELRALVLEKYKKLHPEVTASSKSLTKLAAEDEESDDLYGDLQGLKDEDKIGKASYVQLYALNKYFTKLLKAKEKSEAKNSADEDESVDIEQLERAIGKKPKPDYEFDKGKSILNRMSPEDLKRYETMSANSKMRLSIREAGAGRCSDCGKSLSSEEMSEGRTECSYCSKLS